MKKTVKILSLTIAIVMLVACSLSLVACDDKPAEFFEKTTRFNFDVKRVSAFGGEATDMGSLVNLILDIVTDEEMPSIWALDASTSYIEFKPDGTMHAQIQTAPNIFNKIDAIVGALASFAGGGGEDVGDMNLNAMLADLHLENFIATYIEPMFPGWTDKLKQADLKGAMGLIEASLGFNITGIDTEDEGIKAIVDSIAKNMRESNHFKVDEGINILGAFQALTDENGEGVRIAITFDNTYKIVQNVSADGTVHQSIYIGGLASNASTQPWGVISMTNNADSDDEELQALGGRHIVWRFNVANVSIPCNEVL